MEQDAFNLVYLFNETFDSWIMLFTSFVSIVFAFLVAGTLAAEKLTRFLSGLVVALYSLTSLSFVVLTTIAGTQMSPLLFEIAAAQGAPTPDSTNWLTSTMVTLVSLIMILTYLGSLIFFLHQRRRVVN